MLRINSNTLFNSIRTLILIVFYLNRICHSITHVWISFRTFNIRYIRCEIWTWVFWRKKKSFRTFRSFITYVFVLNFDYYYSFEDAVVNYSYFHINHIFSTFDFVVDVLLHDYNMYLYVHLIVFDYFDADSYWIWVHYLVVEINCL
jgi:hypothetical protein